MVSAMGGAQCAGLADGLAVKATVVCRRGSVVGERESRIIRRVGGQPANERCGHV